MKRKVMHLLRIYTVSFSKKTNKQTNKKYLRPRMIAYIQIGVKEKITGTGSQKRGRIRLGQHYKERGTH